MKKTILLAFLLTLGVHESPIGKQLLRVGAAPPAATPNPPTVVPSCRGCGGNQALPKQDEEPIAEWLNRLNRCGERELSKLAGPRSTKDLIMQRSLNAMPFLLDHLWETRKAPFSYGDDPVLETHPYLAALVLQYRAAGIAAMLDFVASKGKCDLTDEQVHIVAYGLLLYCGFDTAGRVFASNWIDFTEKRLGHTRSLDRLRERLPVTKRTVR